MPHPYRAPVRRRNGRGHGCAPPIQVPRRGCDQSHRTRDRAAHHRYRCAGQRPTPDAGRGHRPHAGRGRRCPPAARGRRARGSPCRRTAAVRHGPSAGRPRAAIARRRPAGRPNRPACAARVRHRSLRRAPAAWAGPPRGTGGGRRLGAGRRPTTGHGRAGVHDRLPRHPGRGGLGHPAAAVHRPACARPCRPTAGPRHHRSSAPGRRNRPRRRTGPRGWTRSGWSDLPDGRRRGARNATRCRHVPRHAGPPRPHRHPDACRPASRCVACRRLAGRARGVRIARCRARCRGPTTNARDGRAVPRRLLPGRSAHQHGSPRPHRSARQHGAGRHHGNAAARPRDASRRRTSRYRHGLPNGLRDHRDRARHDSRVADDRGRNHPRCSPDERTSAATLPFTHRENGVRKA